MLDYRYPSGLRETIHYNGYDTDEDCHIICDCECRDCDTEDTRLTNINSRHDIKKYLEA